MPTASNDMTLKLVTDSETAGEELATLNAYLGKASDADKRKPKGPCKAIEVLLTQHAAIGPQIAKLGRLLNDDPPGLPDEKTYKELRKKTTNIIKFIGITKKAVKKEIAEKKKSVEIQCFAANKSDFIATQPQKKLATAMKTALAGRGRSGPKEDGVDEFLHIHVSGGNVNVLHRKKVLLGTVDFHIDSSNSPSQKRAVKKVAKTSGSKVTLVIGADGVISEKGK